MDKKITKYTTLSGAGVGSTMCHSPTGLTACARLPYRKQVLVDAHHRCPARNIARVGAMGRETGQTNFPGAVARAAAINGVVMSKRTFQPNTRKRSKVHGFRLRMRTRAGRSIVASRRRKGREKLTA